MSCDVGHWAQKISSIKLLLSRIIGPQTLFFVVIENVPDIPAIVIVEFTMVE